MLYARVLCADPLVRAISRGLIRWGRGLGLNLIIIVFIDIFFSFDGSIIRYLVKIVIALGLSIFQVFLHKYSEIFIASSYGNRHVFNQKT